MLQQLLVEKRLSEKPQVPSARTPKDDTQMVLAGGPALVAVPVGVTQSGSQLVSPPTARAPLGVRLTPLCHEKPWLRVPVVVSRIE